MHILPFHLSIFVAENMTQNQFIEENPFKRFDALTGKPVVTLKGRSRRSRPVLMRRELRINA
jgi:hypothetical protein